MAEQHRGLWQPIRRPTRLAGNVLELFLPHGWPESSAPLHWTTRTAAEVDHGVAVDLVELPAGPRWNTLLVWTPPADTVVTRIQLPTRNSRKIAQALPYALEDHLLGDPTQLHFAYQREHDDMLAVAVTARERLQQWLQALQGARLQPSRLCPATLSLPLDVDDWALAYVDDWMWVRSGPYAGFVCPATTETVPPLLTAALREAGDSSSMPARLTVFNAPDGLPVDAWTAALQLEVTLARESLWDARISTVPPLNLLQGEFAPTRGLRNRLRPLLPAAVIIAIWLTGTLAFSFWEWWQLERQHRASQAAMTALFRQTFPETKVVLDPALQMERSLETLRTQTGGVGRGDFLPLLAGVAPTLRVSADANLRTLKYADSKVTLELRLPDFEALENIKNTANATGKIRAEVVAANTQGSGVEGRLRIESRASGETRPNQ
ncbi:MAG: type II secretion system protein GspL [Acidiferrobacterales bacterium]|nr:type II secretion system protein GspL [Acidiferrobacterales bacterium]